MEVLTSTRWCQYVRQRRICIFLWFQLRAIPNYMSRLLDSNGDRVSDFSFLMYRTSAHLLRWHDWFHILWNDLDTIAFIKGEPPTSHPSTIDARDAHDHNSRIKFRKPLSLNLHHTTALEECAPIRIHRQYIPWKISSRNSIWHLKKLTPSRWK